jgi:hypothetical protein
MFDRLDVGATLPALFFLAGAAAFMAAAIGNGNH